MENQVRNNEQYAPVGMEETRDISPASDINRQSAPTSNKIFPEPNSQPGGEKQRKNNVYNAKHWAILSAKAKALQEINKTLGQRNWKRNVLILLRVRPGPGSGTVWSHCPH